MPPWKGAKFYLPPLRINVPQAKVECLYCGHKGEAYVYHTQTEVACEKCRDLNTKVTHIEDAGGDVYGYSYKPRVPAKRTDKSFLKS